MGRALGPPCPGQGPGPGPGPFLITLLAGAAFNAGSLSTCRVLVLSSGACLKDPAFYGEVLAHPRIPELHKDMDIYWVRLWGQLNAFSLEPLFRGRFDFVEIPRRGSPSEQDANDCQKLDLSGKNCQISPVSGSSSGELREK